MTTWADLIEWLTILFGWLQWACVDHVREWGYPALGCPSWWPLP